MAAGVEKMYVPNQTYDIDCLERKKSQWFNEPILFFYARLKMFL